MGRSVFLALRGTVFRLVLARAQNILYHIPVDVPEPRGMGAVGACLERVGLLSDPCPRAFDRLLGVLSISETAQRVVMEHRLVAIHALLSFADCGGGVICYPK